MLARISLVPVVLLASFVSMVATVLLLVGAPMAGTTSAIFAAVVAGLLTIPMALAFSHGEHAAPSDPGH